MIPMRTDTGRTEEKQTTKERVLIILQKSTTLIKKLKFYQDISTQGFNLGDYTEMIGVLEKIKTAVTRVKTEYFDKNKPLGFQKERTLNEELLPEFEKDIKRDEKEVKQSINNASNMTNPTDEQLAQKAYGCIMLEREELISIPQVPVDSELLGDVELNRLNTSFQQILRTLNPKQQLDTMLAMSTAQVMAQLVKQQVAQIKAITDPLSKRFLLLRRKLNSYNAILDMVSQLAIDLRKMLNIIESYGKDITNDEITLTPLLQPIPAATFSGDVKKNLVETTAEFTTREGELQTQKQRLEKTLTQLGEEHQKQIHEARTLFGQTTTSLQSIIGRVPKKSHVAKKLQVIDNKFNATLNSQEPPHLVIKELIAINRELTSLYVTNLTTLSSNLYKKITVIAKPLLANFEGTRKEFLECKFTIMDEDQTEINDFLEMFVNFENLKPCNDIERLDNDLKRVNLLKTNLPTLAEKIRSNLADYDLVYSKSTNPKLIKFIGAFKMMPHNQVEHLLKILIHKYNSRRYCTDANNLCNAIHANIFRLGVGHIVLYEKHLIDLDYEKAPFVIKAIQYFRKTHKKSRENYYDNSTLGDATKTTALYCLLREDIRFEAIDTFMQHGMHTVMKEEPSGPEAWQTDETKRENKYRNTTIAKLIKHPDPRIQGDRLALLRTAIIDLKLDAPFLLVAIINGDPSPTLPKDLSQAISPPDTEHKDAEPEHKKHEDPLQKILLQHKNKPYNITILKVLLQATELVEKNNCNSLQYFTEGKRDLIIAKISAYYTKNNLRKLLGLLRDRNNEPEPDIKNRALLIKGLSDYIKKYRKNDKNDEVTESLATYLNYSTNIILQPGDVADKKQELINLASDTFHNRHLPRRIFLDFVQVLTGLFLLIVPIRWCMGQSGLFSFAKTNREIAVIKEVGRIDDLAVAIATRTGG